METIIKKLAMEVRTKILNKCRFLIHLERHFVGLAIPSNLFQRDPRNSIAMSAEL